jgi:CRP/FNR family transcriptional regulator
MEIKNNKINDIRACELIQDCSTCEYKSLLFNTLEKDYLKKINACKNQFEYKKGEIICKEGEKILDLIYLHKGLVKLERLNNDGKSQIISIAKPFDYIGLLSVFSSKVYKYNLIAIEPSSACLINIDCIRDSIVKNGNFALEIVEKMSRISESVLETKFTLSKKNLRGRIAHILLYFAENIYNSYEFDLPISRSEISELIDMRTENVIRIMSEFRKDKIIKINGPTIEIIDLKLLKAINENG